MRKCSYCGAEIQENYRFCPICGNELSKEKQEKKLIWYLNSLEEKPTVFQNKAAGTKKPQIDRFEEQAPQKTAEVFIKNASKAAENENVASGDHEETKVAKEIAGVRSVPGDKQDREQPMRETGDAWKTHLLATILVIFAFFLCVKGVASYRDVTMPEAFSILCVSALFVSSKLWTILVAELIFWAVYMIFSVKKLDHIRSMIMIAETVYTVVLAVYLIALLRNNGSLYQYFYLYSEVHEGGYYAGYVCYAVIGLYLSYVLNMAKKIVGMRKKGIWEGKGAL